MKKFYLVLLVITSLGLGAFFVQTAFASRSQTLHQCNGASTGNPNDVTFFPYGFICGSDPAFYDPDVFNVSNPAAFDASSNNDDVVNPKLIDDGVTIDFSAWFWAEGLPRNATGVSDVLEWVTINSVNTGFLSLSSPDGGTSLGCPGADAGAVGIVYNFQDNLGGGVNASPQAYHTNPDGTRGGVENCGPGGKMVYWNNQNPTPPKSRLYNFSIRVLPGSAGKSFCVRQNQSVSFSDDRGVFPPPGTDDSSDAGQRYTANHMAKQGARWCYKVRTPVSGGSVTASCTRVSGSFTTPPSGGLYKVFVDGRAVTNQKPITGSTFSDPFDGVGVFGPTATTHTFKLRIYDGGGTQVGPDHDNPVTQACPERGAQNCVTYTHDLGVHSWYKFTVFPYNVPFANSPPANATFNAGNPGSPANWQGYAAAPVQEVIVQSSPGPVPNYTITFPPPSGPDWLIYIERWEHVGANWVYSSGASAEPNCYNASCEISVGGGLTPPGGGANDHEAGTAYDTVAVIHNIGSQPLQALAWTGDADINGNPVQGLSIPPGAPPGDPDATQAIVKVPGAVAPTVLGSYVVGGVVYSHGYAVTTCVPAGVNVYQHFTISASAGIGAADAENPVTIVYNTAAGINPAGDPFPYPFGGPIGTGVHSQLFRRPTVGGNFLVQQVDRSDNFDAHNYADTYNNPNPIVAGDQYCPQMVVDLATGWLGPGGVLDGAGSTTPGGCLTVVDKPIFQAFNGGLSAGGNFPSSSPTCSGGGTLGGWNNNTGSPPPPFGSGTGLAALALIKITGVASAKGTALGGAPGKYLSFGNVPPAPASTTSTDSPVMGGGFGLQHCFTDPTAPDGTPTDVSPTATVSALLPGAHKAASATSLSGGAPLAPGSSRAIYVTGDVYIGSDITYSTLLPWAYNPAAPNTSSVPSFTLIVTGGNIYIDPNVTQLDGIYVAKSIGATGGNIYTCGTSSFSVMPAGSLFGSCNKQLTVNGAFIANGVKLMRTYGSLRDDKSSHALGIGCSNKPPLPITVGFSGTTCSAEVFRFSPEMYLSNQPIKKQANGANVFDSLSSLPPVL